MKIQITYQFKTANGFPITSKVIAESKEEAERYCKNIENLADEGYKLIDVTRIAETQARGRKAPPPKKRKEIKK